jgi:sec-independent protein translocase protein TatB
MPSFQDSAVIFFIALLLFGPKKLPELARYVGKLMNEFRRASNEFRMQMEDEFRQSEQVEQQKKIAAIEAAAPIAPTISAETVVATEESLDQPAYEPHTPEVPTMLEPANEIAIDTEAPSTEPVPAPKPIPIASNGDLHMMPPATGLPVSRSFKPASGLLDFVPQTAPHLPDPAPAAAEPEHETQAHG